MEIEKNIFTFIIYTIIITVIGAIAVIAVTQAINNNSTVSDLQTNIKSLETSFNTLQENINEKLDKNDNDWKNVIKSGDELAIVYPSTIPNNTDYSEWRMLKPSGCNWNSADKNSNQCKIDFSGGISIGSDGGWKLYKKNE